VETVKLATIAIALALSSSGLHAQRTKPGEYDVKATYLFNFGRFATWPPAVTANENAFAVCVLGRDPFGPALDATLTGEKIGGQRTVARRITKPQEAGGCRILFVSDSEESQLASILQSIGNASILTVSDIREFVERGGMIQFVSQGNKIRFEVNLAATERANVMLSSELLKVATVVHRSARPGA
jgi:hypothetical protein